MLRFINLRVDDQYTEVCMYTIFDIHTRMCDNRGNASCPNTFIKNSSCTYIWVEFVFCTLTWDDIVMDTPDRKASRTQAVLEEQFMCGWEMS